MTTFPAISTARENRQTEKNFLHLLNTQLSAGQEGEQLAELEIAKPLLKEKKGLVELSFTLNQRQTTPRPLDLFLLIITPGQSFTTTISSREAATPISLLLPEPPSEIRLDPYLEARRRLSVEETPPTWAGFINAPRRLAIRPDQPPPDNWAFLLAYLAEQGIEVLPLAEAQDREMTGAALLFLSDGASNPGSSLLGRADLSAAITLDARKNPLDPRFPAILLNLPPVATDTEIELLLSQLRDNALVSQLQLQDGKVLQRRLTSTEAGIRVLLDRPPDGIPASSRLDFRTIMAELADTRVIHVGEIHTRYEDHLLQLRVLRAMHRQNPRLAIGLEMLPPSAQPALDAYVAGTIDEGRFLKESRWFDNWNFDYRLYREIIDFARLHRLPLIALNLEKGVTSKVFRQGGISALDPEERDRLPAERDHDLPGYRERIAAAFRMHDQEDDPDEQLRRFGGFLQAQSLWDEQMAAAMAQFLSENPEHRMLAILGRGHTDKRNAIPPRLARRLPVSQAVLVPAREHGVSPDAADYFIFTEPQSLPEPALLGVLIQDGGEDSPGALIAGVSPQGKAHAAGIKEKDLIIALDGNRIDDAADLRIALLYKEKGQTIQVRVRRSLQPPQQDPPEVAAEKKDEFIDIMVEL